MVPGQERQKLQYDSQHRLLYRKLTNILEIHYNPIRVPTSFLPPANEVWGKVIFLHLSVILFTGGTYLGRYPPGQVHPLAGTPPLGRYTCSACWDTVNKRAVRILLECILVTFFFRRKAGVDRLFRPVRVFTMLRSRISRRRRFP